MTENNVGPFIIIYLGNPNEFVLKNIHENKTYGVFKKSVEKPMHELCHELNNLNGRLIELEKTNQLVEREFIQYKQQVQDELQSRYDLSNRRLVYKYMAQRLGVELE